MIVHMHIPVYILIQNLINDRHYCFDIVLCYVLWTSKHQFWSSFMIVHMPMPKCTHMAFSETKYIFRYVKIYLIEITAQSTSHELSFPFLTGVLEVVDDSTVESPPSLPYVRQLMIY